MTNQDGGFEINTIWFIADRLRFDFSTCWFSFSKLDNDTLVGVKIQVGLWKLCATARKANWCLEHKVNNKFM